MMVLKSHSQKNDPRCIAIGPAVSKSGGQITGQAMMFQLMVDSLLERGWRVRVFDISERRKSGHRRTIGKFSFSRMFDYVRLIPD